MLGEWSWLGSLISGEAGQVRVQQFLNLIVWKILRAWRARDILLTNGE